MGLMKHVPVSWSDYGNVAYREGQYSYGAKAGTVSALISAGATSALFALAKSRGINMHASVKCSTIAMAGIFAGVFAADKAGLRFERINRTDQGTAILSKAAQREQEIWAALTPKEKAMTWLKNHRAATVTTGGAACIAFFALAMRRQPLTAAQKLVQARVAAQSFTVASALGVAGLTSVPTPGDKINELRDQEVRDSWRSTLRAQGVLPDA